MHIDQKSEKDTKFGGKKKFRNLKGKKTYHVKKEQNCDICVFVRLHCTLKIPSPSLLPTTHLATLCTNIKKYT